jgi:hypothetical protein
MALSANEIAIIIKARDEASQTFKGIKEAAGGLGDKFKVLAGMAIGAVSAFASFKTLESAVSTTQELGAEINKLKREIGGTAEDSSKLLFAFKHLGLSGDDASTSLGILAKKLKGISDEETGVLTGGKSMAGVLEDIGVKTFTATGELASMGQILPQVAEVFKNMPDGVEKTGLAMQLFGRSGKDMIPVLNKGAEGLAALGVEAEKFGLVLSEQSLKDIKDYTAAQRDLGAGFEGIKLQIGLAVLPALTDLIALFANSLPTIRAWIEQGLVKIGDFLTAHEEDIRNFGQGVRELAEDGFQRLIEVGPPLLAVLADMAAMFQEVATNLVPILADALVVVGGLLEDHPALVYAIVAAYAAFQIGGFVENLAGIASGLFGVATAAGVATGSLYTLKAALITTGIGAVLVLLATDFYIFYTNWSTIWPNLTQIVEKAVNLCIDALNLLIDWIWRLPLAETLFGKKPQVEQAAFAVGDAAGRTMAETLWAWSANMGDAGAAGGALYIARMAAVLSDGLRRLAGTVVAGFMDVMGGPTGGKEDILFGPFRKAASVMINSLTASADAMGAFRVEAEKTAASAKTILPPVVDLGAGLGGLTSGAGGAAEAFRGLDADLAALRQEMIATAEAGLAVLNSAIAGEEDYLASLTGALDQAQAAHDDLAASIQGATDEMNEWENAVLKGTEAFSDTAARFGRTMDKLQLQINKLELEKKLGTKTAGQIEVIDAQIEKLGEQLDILRLKAENSNLTENLQLGPLREQLDDLMHPVKEFSFDEIVAGWQGSKAELADYLVLLARNEDYMAKITAAQEQHQAILENLKAAADELSKALDTGIDTVIKSAWEARGDIVVKSIEDAFAAMDRGDKAAAQAALDDANALFARIKALTGGTEAGLFAGIEKVLADTETAINVDVSGMADQVGDDLAKVGVVVQKSTGDILTTLKDSVVFYLETIRNRLDIINDTLVSIPSAQHGGAVLGGGLVAVHPGETIVPVGGRAGGNTIILAPVFNGPVMGDQRQADEFVRRMLPYLKRHVG